MAERRLANDKCGAKRAANHALRYGAEPSNLTKTQTKKTHIKIYFPRSNFYLPVNYQHKITW